MNPTPELDRLCAYFGVAATYRDFEGNQQHADDHTRRALLRALGVEAGDPQTEGRSLDEAVDREWRRVLPPVVVRRQGDPPPTLALTLPDHGPEMPRFVLIEEDGARADGVVNLAALPVDERRDIDGQPWARRSISVPTPPVIGYHRLFLYADADSTSEPEHSAAPLAETTVIVAPDRCWQPDSDGGRTFGLITQLYALRSSRNWGIGDFTDLIRLVEIAAEGGAAMIALTPLHALFPAQPERCDPYAPSSRRFLNPLHIDVEAAPDLGECDEAGARIADDDFQAMLRALRAAAEVDYGGVAAAKLDLLSRLFRHFRARHIDTGSERARAFAAFRADEGEALEQFALYQALAEHLAATEDGVSGFESWPEPYRDPASREVRDFAATHCERVDFHAWLQWLARQQLDAAAARCRALDMRYGLCLDLAVGTAPDGADRWAAPGSYVSGAHVGAPPDDFSPKGQNWHVLAWHPLALRENGYAAFAAELRANMRAAGALRIDHVMGLMQLYLVPEGAPERGSTYVSYPFEELLGIVALESVRNRCMIIGEDLGTVPDEVRDAMAANGMLSTRVLYFERDDDGGFLSPADYSSEALVTAGTHDLPPLAGFWQGVDLERRRQLSLFPSEQEYEQRLLRRGNDRTRLLLALDREGLLPADGGADPVAVPSLTPAHLEAIQVYLARTPSRLLLIQTADLLGETEQVNLPGSGRAYPNWRRRQALGIEHWPEQPGIARTLEAVRAERGASAAPSMSSGAEGNASAREATPEGAVEPEQQASAGRRGGPREPPLQATIPRATYRLQLHAGFGFADAAALVPYLDALGISHCYCSPYLKARPGSSHGYDVVAHDRLNPELGSTEDYAHFCETLRAHGMGQIVDMVPNHVGIMGAENPWWLDVLENGPASAYADFFDIDWQPLKQELRDKVLVPVLGGHYGEILDRGELVLVFEDGAFRVDYYEHRFPIDPREYPHILAPGLDGLRERLGEDAEALAVFESLVTAFSNLPPRDAADETAHIERRRDKELHKQRLADLYAEHADIQRYVNDCLQAFNGSDDYPADTGRLHTLLEAQAYRLAHWRVAADEINYRRFFDINDLAALRVENPEVFEATHSLVLSQIAEGRIDGLRIDHPDGLYDPQGYFERLQRRAAALLYPTRDPRDDDRPLYLLAEKILVGDEQLRAEWPVHGTTGYDFATLCDALFVDPLGEHAMDVCYREFSGTAETYGDSVYAAKRLVMEHLVSSELHVLASELSRIAEMRPHTRDYTLDALRGALMEIVACFPVYRTYISERGMSPADRHQVLKAVSEARRRSRMPDLSVIDFVRDVLLTDIADGQPDAYRARVLRLALKFQQYTGPVTAKGVEDTAFYRWNRLVSLNEVGGDPQRFGLAIEAFHRTCARRRTDWPHALLAGSTHDSKRSEDVRARLSVLSEIPEVWSARVQRWTLMNRRLRRESADGKPTPDPNTEYLFYQTLVGIWFPERPEGEALDRLRERLRAYMEKAAKEAKLHTAWTNANADYEAALVAFVDAATDPERSAPFLDDFERFLRPVARLGLYNSLSQTLLRLTVPGVPDIYQGTELWNFSLVDPDNRRPVDFERRRGLLRSLPAATASGADPQAEPGSAPVRELSDFDRGTAADGDEGRIKLHLIHRALRLRRHAPALFSHGGYRPLTVKGPHAERLCAFARDRAETEETRPDAGDAGIGAVVVLAPRLVARLASPPDDGKTKAEADKDFAALDPFADEGWKQTFVELPAGLRDVAFADDELGGERIGVSERDGAPAIRASDVLRRFPVGLLSIGAAAGGPAARYSGADDEPSGH